MSMTHPPTPQEQEAAARRYEETVRRGTHLIRRRRIAAASGAAIATVGLAIGLLVALPGGKTTKVNIESTSLPPAPTTSATTTPATTTPATTTAPTTAPPTTAVSMSEATTQLDAFVIAIAAREKAAAQAAGVPWNGYMHTPPVVGGCCGLVSIVAFSYDPHATPLQVLRYSDGQWGPLAFLPPPPGQGYAATAGAMNSYWLPTFPEAAISVKDVTGDGRPDFMIPLNAADNLPVAVVSQDGASGSVPWRWVPFAQGSSPTLFYVLPRWSPQIGGSALTSVYNNCVPSCAQGTNYPITWTYQRSAGRFWAPSPP